MTFHPDHEPLHGITVVVSGASGRTYVGRYHERNGRGILLHDAGIHDPGSAAYPREEWLRRQDKFGIRAEQRALLIPSEEAGEVVPFPDWLAANR
ncbi:MAG: hypothetical protein ACREMH_07205 [Gemmatimonadales bacterium]